MSHVLKGRTCREEEEEDKDLLGLMEVGVGREGVEHQVVVEAVVEVAWGLLVGEVGVGRDREDHDDEVRNEVGKVGDDEGDEAKYCRYQTEVWKGKVHDLEGQRKEGGEEISHSRFHDDEVNQGGDEDSHCYLVHGRE